MEKDRKRALRRMKSRNKWHSRIRELYYYSHLLKVFDYYYRGLHYTSWKDILDAKWSKVYKSTASDSTSYYHKERRYKRTRFLRETKRIIKEDLYD